MKVAVTVSAAVSVMLHVEVPEHAPDHPENVLFCEGVPVRTTAVFWAKFAEQPFDEPEAQLIPAGLLVTVPVPAPCTVTVMENWGGGGGVDGTPAHPNMNIAGSATSQRHSWFRRQIMRNVLYPSQNWMKVSHFRLLPLWLNCLTDSHDIRRFFDRDILPDGDERTCIRRKRLQETSSSSFDDQYRFVIDQRRVTTLP